MPVISVRIDEGLLSAVDAEAKRCRWSRSATVVHLLNQALLTGKPMVYSEQHRVPESFDVGTGKETFFADTACVTPPVRLPVGVIVPLENPVVQQLREEIKKREPEVRERLCKGCDGKLSRHGAWMVCTDITCSVYGQQQGR